MAEFRKRKKVAKEASGGGGRKGKKANKEEEEEEAAPRGSEMCQVCRERGRRKANCELCELL